MKVLVVVDVQNCFIYKGSLGNPEANMTLIREIESMVQNGGYDMIVFSRDSHPPNHESFSIYPDHCRDMSKQKCPKSITKKVPTIGNTLLPSKTIGELAPSVSDPTIASLPVIGTDLAYMYYLTDIHQLVFSPHYIIKKSDTEINILDNDKAKRSISRTYAGIKTDKPIIIHLSKGEYCDSDAYSAFNYHIKYSGNSANPEIPLQTQIKYSTGLAEIIFERLPKSNDRSCIDIDICGLAGNICVINTFVHGSALFKQILSRNSCVSPNVLRDGKPYCFKNTCTNNLFVKLNYHYFQGTRFLPIPGILGNFTDLKLPQNDTTNQFVLNYVNGEIKKNDELKDLTLTKEKDQSNGVLTIHLDQTTIKLYPTVYVDPNYYNPMLDDSYYYIVPAISADLYNPVITVEPIVPLVPVYTNTYQQYYPVYLNNKSNYYSLGDVLI